MNNKIYNVIIIMASLIIYSINANDLTNMEKVKNLFVLME